MDTMILPAPILYPTRIPQPGEFADIRFNYAGYYTTPAVAYSAGSEITVSLDSSSFFRQPQSGLKLFFPNH